MQHTDSVYLDCRDRSAGHSLLCLTCSILQVVCTVVWLTRYLFTAWLPLSAALHALLASGDNAAAAQCLSDMSSEAQQVEPTNAALMVQLVSSPRIIIQFCSTSALWHALSAL